MEGAEELERAGVSRSTLHYLTHSRWIHTDSDIVETRKHNDAQEQQNRASDRGVRIVSDAVCWYNEQASPSIEQMHACMHAM
jgi:hypothetical protein